MKTTKKKRTKHTPIVATVPPAPPVFAEVWGNSPNDQDESLQVGTDGTFRVVKGGDVDLLTDPAKVVEYILQSCLDKSHWNRFAAFMPTLYPAGNVGSKEPVTSATVTFPPGATALLVAGAMARGQTLEEYVMHAAASHVLCLVCDAQPDEEPALAALFGIGEEVTA